MPEKNTEIVDINKLPSNSRKSKDVDAVSVPNTKIQKVITGNAIKQKKSFVDKFAETFFGDDAKTVIQYVVWDVMIPAAKNTISDMVQTGVEMLLFGKTYGSRTRRDRDKSFVSYGSFYSRGGDREKRSSRRGGRATSKFENVVLETREEAEEVLSAMVELVDLYNVVSVADLYALIGEESDYTDDRYGWTSVSRARVDRVRDGYMIVLPRPMPIE